MTFPFYIAKRYLFSKKSTHAINIISGISAVGVAVATMALVVTLSVFNGFSDLVATFFTSFDPQLKIVPAKGKTMPADAPALDKVRQLTAVEVATNCLEDQALAVYQDKQEMVTVKGVDDNFTDLVNIKDILVGDGVFDLHAANLEYGVIGIRLAQTLGTGTKWRDYLHIFAPRHEGQLDMTNPTEGFVEDSLLSPGVVFQVKQAKYDKAHIITSLDFASRIFERQGEISSLELRIKSGSDINSVKKDIQEIVGDQYKVEDRYEQQADTFRIMQIEKVMAYIFLTFILMVACFNIIGSLSMLIIDKKDDVVTLRNLGATDKQITQIFLFEGRMISAAGAIIGIIIGLLLCWLQQQFGIVRLGSGSENFIIDAYPVSVHYSDVLIIFITVMLVGWLAVWYPVRAISKRLTK
ncbi:MAG: ABC transporter permease [Prevotella sp.]|jgi:lipoprotein-releasing system permease protein|nr:ABC transporter permease [Prevotella sp.]MBR4368123.1 ABC transporter permease [Prevotella sp.]MBR7049207.1 ABC transporter permease [Prevotella sp.]